MAAVGLPVWQPGVWADTVWADGVWASDVVVVGGGLPRPILSAGQQTRDPLTIISIKWVGAVTPGDQCIIDDPDNNILWHSVAYKENYEEVDMVGDEWPSGFDVDTLDSGALYVNVVRGKYA